MSGSEGPGALVPDAPVADADQYPARDTNAFGNVAAGDLPAAPIDPRAQSVCELVDRWMVDCIHNSPVSRETAAINHLITVALPELKRRILGDS